MTMTLPDVFIINLYEHIKSSTDRCISYHKGRNDRLLELSSEGVDEKLGFGVVKGQRSWKKNVD